MNVNRGGNINFNVDKNDRHIFGIAAFQYFTELVGRLSRAPIIRYAGEKTFKNTNYEQVYVTWGSLEQNDAHDQYILFVNKKTDMLEYAIFTLRENYIKMPGAGMFYGSIGYSDFRDINGFKVAFVQNLFVFEPNEDNDDYLHRLTLESFEFDNFEIGELYPNKSLSNMGDAK